MKDTTGRDIGVAALIVMVLQFLSLLIFDVPFL
jgi:hypothetical protein